MAAARRAWNNAGGYPSHLFLPVTALSVLLCFCTCPDDKTAMRLADTLVGERLAACVNIVPGLRSVYRWQGAVECGNEVLLLIKTTRARLPALSARVVELHPHELPEVVAVEVAGGLSAYLDWVAEQASDSPIREIPADSDT